MILVVNSLNLPKREIFWIRNGMLFSMHKRGML